MTQETPEKVLYDADRAQCVPLKITQDGAVFEVAHTFGPIDDEGIATILDATEDARPQALSDYWLHSIKDLSGYGEPISLEDFPACPFDERFNAVNEGLLLAVILPRKAEGKPAFKRSGEQYPLRCFFDGQFVETSIKLDPYSADHYRVWQRLEAGQFPVKFGDHKIQSYSQGVKVLFDALCSAFYSYGERVPLHHKELVIRQHFTGQSAAVLAKKS